MIQRLGSPKSPGDVRGLVVFLSLIGLVTAGAASATPESMGAKSVAERQDPTLDDILAVSPKMKAFLEKETGDVRTKQFRLRALMTAIFDQDSLGIEYGNTRTKTAAETFETASGNCLSFTLMFVAMARELGLGAYFVEVDEVTSWSNEGDADINAWHMFAEVDLDNGFIRVDFLPGIDKRYRRKRRISDSRVAAHYFNNLGVEALTDGRTEEARRLLRKALELDRKFLPALVNLGVAHRRAGDPLSAEKSLRRALDLERSNLQAARNLASLYRSTGQLEKAGPLMRRVERYLDRNPFHHYRESQEAVAAGDLRRAAEHLAEAIRRQSDVSRFHEALATVRKELGEPKKALSSLRRAIVLTEDEDRKRALEKRLARWKGGA